jgi:hypothetical protein
MTCAVFSSSNKAVALILVALRLCSFLRYGSLHFAHCHVIWEFEAEHVHIQGGDGYAQVRPPGVGFLRGAALQILTVRDERRSTTVMNHKCL